MFEKKSVIMNVDISSHCYEASKRGEGLYGKKELKT